MELKDLSKEDLEEIGEAILNETFRRKKDYTGFDRYEVDLDVGKVLVISPNGICAKCKEWPGSDR